MSTPGDLTEQELDALLRRLHLAHMRRVYMEIARKAEEESWSYRDFLSLLVREEVAHRKQTRLQRLTHRASFPYLKTIDDFDFSLQTSLRATLIGSYLGPDFVAEGRSLILHGKTGRGKTHLAIAIAYRAIQNGFEALFTTAAELFETLDTASQKGRLHEALLAYTHPHVLVIDEVGYLTYSPDAANVLYHVVNGRHLRRRPMIFTTNKALREWAACCTTTTSRWPSSTECSSAAASSPSTGPPPGPVTSTSTRLCLRTNNGPEFPESPGQNFRNPQRNAMGT